MALRRYLRWLSIYWFGLVVALASAGLIAGVVVGCVASTAEVTKFTALCTQQHGKVYRSRGGENYLCVRGVELEFPEFEEEDR